MAALECRAVGTVEDSQLEALSQLLLGLSACPPDTLEQQEVVLKAPASASTASGVPAAWKPDLRLQRDLAPSIGGHDTAAPDTWTVLQFSLHLRGKQHAALPATVRHVTRATCTGEDVPAFWQSLGFAPRYQLLRRGRRYMTVVEGQDVEVTVSSVLRLPASGARGVALDAAALQQAEELAPGRQLVEAVACVPSDADHMEMVGTVTALSALLQPYVTLQRPPRAPGEPM